MPSPGADSGAAREAVQGVTRPPLHRSPSSSPAGHIGRVAQRRPADRTTHVPPARRPRSLHCHGALALTGVTAARRRPGPLIGTGLQDGDLAEERRAQIVDHDHVHRVASAVHVCDASELRPQRVWPRDLRLKARALYLLDLVRGDSLAGQAIGRRADHRSQPGRGHACRVVRLHQLRRNGRIGDPGTRARARRGRVDRAGRGGLRRNRSHLREPQAKRDASRDTDEQDRQQWRTGVHGVQAH